MVNKKLFEKFRIMERENIYLEHKHNILDLNKVKEFEDDLINIGEYLPFLIRNSISIDYYHNIRVLDFYDNILLEIFNSRDFSIEEQVLELLEWVNNHNDFKSLIVEEELLSLSNDLESLGGLDYGE